MKKKFPILILIIFLLVSCTSQTNELSTQVVVDEPIFTSTPTLTPEPTLTPDPTEIPYFELSSADRLSKSQALVEQAGSYDGEVWFDWNKFTESGEFFPIYWSSQGWTTSSENSTGGLPPAELDIRGETLPPFVMPGYENPEGSLVMIDPRTDEETVFEGIVFVAGIGNVAIRDLFAMGQVELGDIVVEQALTSLDPDTQAAKYESLDKADEGVLDSDDAQGVQEQALFIPGFWTNSNLIYPIGISGASGPNVDAPEVGLVVGEWRAEEFIVPIFSPETGEFMFFLNLQRGRLSSVEEYKYDQDGHVEYERQTGGGNFENSGFGILIEHPNPYLSHYKGGHNYMFSGDEVGIGEANVTQDILQASTEDEIIDILRNYRIVFSVPFRVFQPED